MLPEKCLKFTSIIPFQLLAVIVLFLIFSCRDEQIEKTGRKVYIQKENKNYTLYRDGKPFEIKGAAGQSNLEKLHEIGGNSIRTYDTLNLRSVLE